MMRFFISILILLVFVSVGCATKTQLKEVEDSLLRADKQQQEEIAAQKQQLTAQQKIITDLETQNRELTNTITAISDKLEQMDLLVALTRQVSYLLTAVQETQVETLNEKERLDSVQAELITLQSQLEKSQELLAGRQETLTKVQDELTKIQTELDRLAGTSRPNLSSSNQGSGDADQPNSETPSNTADSTPESSE
jgi:chromosome segregation ATPase